MDAAVGDEFFEGEFGNVAADEVEAGNDDGAGGVVYDDVDAGGLFEGVDVAAFAADDAAFHFVGGELYDGDGGFGGDFG